MKNVLSRMFTSRQRLLHGCCTGNNSIKKLYKIDSKPKETILMKQFYRPKPMHVNNRSENSLETVNIYGGGVAWFRRQDLFLDHHLKGNERFSNFFVFRRSSVFKRFRNVRETVKYSSLRKPFTQTLLYNPRKLCVSVHAS